MRRRLTYLGLGVSFMVLGGIQAGATYVTVFALQPVEWWEVSIVAAQAYMTCSFLVLGFQYLTMAGDP